MSTAPPPNEARSSNGRPPSGRGVPVGEAVSRNWRLVLAPILILTILALALAWARGATFTSEARLNVGGPTAVDSVEQQVRGNVAFAEILSRRIDTPNVFNAIADSVGEGGTFEGDVSATPIPASPIIRVIAEAGDSESAIALANAATDALVGDFQNDSSRERQSTQLLEAATDAEEQKRDAQIAVNRAQNNFDDNPTEANETALNDAERALTRATFLQENAERQYTANAEKLAVQTELDVLSPAIEASSDRLSTLQALLFLAIVGGGAIGIALAMLRERYPATFAGLPGARPPRPDEIAPQQASAGRTPERAERTPRRTAR